MNRRDVHFPAKSVRRKHSRRSHGRDLLDPGQRRDIEHRHRGQGKRYGHRRQVETTVNAAQTTTIATLPTAVLVLPKEFTTLPPRVAVNPADNTPAGDVLGSTTSTSLSLSTGVTELLTSAIQNATRALTSATLGSTTVSNLAAAIPSLATTLTGGTTEVATLPPLSTTNSLLSQVATESVASIVTATSTLNQGGTNITTTTSSRTLPSSSSFAIITPFQNTTTSASQTRSGLPSEGFFGGFPFPFPTTGTSFSLPTAFPTFTAPLNITGSVTLPPAPTSLASVITSAIGNLTEPLTLPISATNVESSLISELPTSSISQPIPVTEVPSPSQANPSATQTPSEVISPATQVTNLSPTFPATSTPATGKSPINSISDTAIVGATSVNPTDIITNLPSNLTTLPFPSITSIPTFFNISATPFATSTSVSLLNGTSGITTSLIKSSFATSTGLTWISEPTGANNPSATGTGASGPGATSSISPTPSSTATSAVVPLVPAIVGSLGGVALLAALGILLLAARRRRTRPTSALLESEPESPFMTEGDFTVLSGQRLGTGVSGQTPIVYRDGTSPTSGTTVSPIAPRGRAVGSRFMEDL